MQVWFSWSAADIPQLIQINVDLWNNETILWTPKSPLFAGPRWCQSSAALRRSKALPTRARNLEIRFLTLNWPGRLCLGDQVEGHSPEKKCSSQQLQKERLQLLFGDWSPTWDLLRVLIALLEAKTFKGKATHFPAPFYSCQSDEDFSKS